jgi:ribonuclease P protein component
VLPAERRVRRREDFTAAVRQGRRVGSPGLVVHVSSEAGDAPARAGFIVGRNVGNAVRRNRLRRQLRHVIAPRLASCPAGLLIVVRAAAPATRFTSAELAASLDGLLDRALAAGHTRAPVASC